MTDITITSRAAHRKALASFLRERMQTPKNVLDHVPADLSGNYPATCVTGAPTGRERMEGGIQLSNRFGFGIRNITAYHIDGQESSWTPQNAEDMLDALEYELTIALLAADRQAEVQGWVSVTRNGLSVIEGPYKIGGISYLSETVPIVMEVDDE